MKKFKILCAGLLLCLGITSLSSCNDSTGDIDMTEDANLFQLQSVSLNTENAKTIFNVGDEFSYEGLKVNGTLRKTDENSQVETKDVEITTYSVNTDAVDMNTIGQYLVIVKARYETKSISASYTINVVSKYSSSTEEYLAGLKVEVLQTSTGYKDAHTVSFKQGSTFASPTVSASRIYFKGTEVSKTETVNVLALTVDTSNVDTTKRGSYVVTYSYTKDDVTVKAFVIVEVTNPVTAIAFKSGTTSQNTSVNGFNYKDWVFTLTRETGDTEDFKYDEDYITIEGINSLLVGTYTATIKYKDEDLAASKSTTTSVEVLQSNSTIVIETDFSQIATAVSSTEKVKLGSTEYFYFLGGKGGDGKTTEYDNLTFNYRGKAGGGSATSNHLEVNMPGAGSIVLYVGASSGTRVMKWTDGDGNTMGQENVSGSPTKLILEVSKAGTYYFFSTSGDIYYFGAIIAYTTE